jgi:tRNA (uracil-5-)-methyltransferase TRM9
MCQYNRGMKEETIRKLLTINDQFYQSFGPAFAETRRRIQPGVERILESRIAEGSWLDLGCGSGALASRWVQAGIKGLYWGLDFSEPLLTEAISNAKQLNPVHGLTLRYSKANLLDDDWQHVVGESRFEGVLAFASLHHLPGGQLREGVIRAAGELLKPGGVFIHSEWQFHNSPKLLGRVQPWSAVGLTDADVEVGDFLLDWRHTTGEEGQPTGLRYVHLFAREELAQLAASSGFTQEEEFESDGAGGNLALYQVWKKA